MLLRAFLHTYSNKNNTFFHALIMTTQENTNVNRFEQHRMGTWHSTWYVIWRFTACKITQGFALNAPCFWLPPFQTQKAVVSNVPQEDLVSLMRIVFLFLHSYVSGTKMHMYKNKVERLGIPKWPAFWVDRKSLLAIWNCLLHFTRLGIGFMVSWGVINGVKGRIWIQKSFLQQQQQQQQQQSCARGHQRLCEAQQYTKCLPAKWEAFRTCKKVIGIYHIWNPSLWSRPLSKPHLRGWHLFAWPATHLSSTQKNQLNAFQKLVSLHETKIRKNAQQAGQHSTEQNLPRSDLMSRARPLAVWPLKQEHMSKASCDLPALHTNLSSVLSIASVAHQHQAQAQTPNAFKQIHQVQKDWSGD